MLWARSVSFREGWGGHAFSQSHGGHESHETRACVTYKICIPQPTNPDCFLIETHRIPYSIHNQTIRTVDGEMTKAEDISSGACGRKFVFVCSRLDYARNN